LHGRILWRYAGALAAQAGCMAILLSKEELAVLVFPGFHIVLSLKSTDIKR
jgi:hypothetical protein